MSQGILSAFSDWILALAGVIASGLFGGAGIIKRNHDRSRKNERQLTGDPSDPNNEGVLQISKRNSEKLTIQGEKIDRLDAKVGRVLDRVEDLASDEKRRYDGGGKRGDD